MEMPQCSHIITTKFTEELNPMKKVTIYLDRETYDKLQTYTKSRGIFQSRWIAELIREKLVVVWPAEVVALAGAWKDFPSLEELRPNR